MFRVCLTTGGFAKGFRCRGGGGVQLKLGLFRSWNRVYGTKHHDQLRNRPSSGFAMCARQELNNLNIGREPGFKLFNSRPRIK